jgi:glucose/arabinose dehydrogenase
VRRTAARIAASLALLLALFSLPAVAAAEPSLPPGFQDEVVLAGLEQPTNFRFAPDGRIFVAEKPGRILVFDGPEDKTATVFADLRTDVYDNGDRGLLGIELDPEFEAGRPYVYALYTWDHVLGTPWNPAEPEYGDPGVSGDPSCFDQNTNGSCLVSGRLVRLTEDALSPDHAVISEGRPKEEQLLEGWCQQFSSHSIGELQFGTEGALYVSGGDGANYESIPDYGQLGTPANPCGDAPTPVGVKPESSPGKPLKDAKGGALRSQNLALLNGAILRIDPDTGNAFPGNPLEGTTGDPNALRTVAKGFRNPFRFVFDSQTGEIYSGNVGSSEIEEIDRFQAPPSTVYNSGWPCYEGIAPQFQFRKLTEETGLEVCADMYASDPSSLPLFSFSHKQTVVPGDECPTQSGSAIGGLSFYEGSQFPAKYQGALFFSDAVRGCFWVMYPGANGKPDPSTTERFLREGSIYPGVKIAEGPGGYLYYADLLSDEGAGDGEIHRIAYQPHSPIAKLEATAPFGLYDGSGKFETELDAGASTDPDGKALDYAWDLNEDGEFESDGGETRTLTFTKTEQETREGKGESPNRIVAIKVEDDEHLTSVARITIYPGDKPPTVTITEPSSSFRWGVGDEIDLNASATDAKGNGIFEPLPYYWVTRMAHCPNLADPTACHIHPLQTFSGIKHAELLAPQHEYPSYIDVVVRVSDKRGLSGTATMRIDPRTVDLSLSSNPAGIELLAGSDSQLTPFSTKAIDGSEILISAPSTAVVEGKTYTFASWSDGGGREHPIIVSPSNATFSATYAAPSEGGGSGGTGGGGTGGTGGGGGGGGGGAKPPQTVLGKHPPASTRSTIAKFTFSASVGGAKFSCKLDGKPKGPCRSPKSYKKLKPGRHAFKVWASAGVLSDPTPAKFGWKVLPPKR